MPVEVRVPTLGESVTEATVAAWLKQEGEAVEAGEPLVELETDKVNVDVAAERSGVLSKIQRAAGETVQPGDVLATVSEGSAASVASSGASAAPAGETTNGASAGASGGAASLGSSGGIAPASPSDGGVTVERPHASPVARRMADEHGIDLHEVEGSGTGGRVTREDVEQFLERQQSRPRLAGAPAGQVATAPMPMAASAAAPVQPSPQPSASQPSASQPSAPQPSQPAAPTGTPARGADPRGEERVRMSRRRQTIAQRLVEAQHTAAMLTTFNEVDMTAVMELRKRRREGFQQRHGVGLGFMSFFTKAVVGALKGFPELNAEVQGTEIVLKRYYDIGIAVGAPEGLVVPVVRDADRKSFAEIEREIARFAQKVKDNSLTLEDLRGGTFTITNGGVFGSMMSTPILSPPQVGILGMHRIQERPMVRDGQIVARPMMYLALSYDHRLVDGREAVQFLVQVRDLIEDPESLLLEG